MLSIGIDLGTTNSCVAVHRDGDTEILENREGSRITPSVVASSNGEIMVGAVARRQAATNPETVTSVKRLIGRRFEEVETGFHPFEIHNRDGLPAVSMNGEYTSPEEISSMVLAKLKEDAESKLGEPVSGVVITVPAYFDDPQRQATKDAARIAGLEVLRIINEPTAAALSYGIRDESDENVLVFDLGGGTFDVSVLETGDGVFDVKATSGDNSLGGDDFDRAIAVKLTAHLKEQTGIDLSSDKASQVRILEASEKAKSELSSAPETTVSVPFIAMKDNQPVHLEEVLTRSSLEEICDPLVDRLEKPVRQALADAGNPRLDRVIMVGGMSRMPAVQAKVKQITGIEPSQGVNPDEAVAKGAAIQAAIITGETDDLLLLDVTPLSLGVETKGGITTCMFPRNTTVPARRTEIFSTAEHDQESVEIHVVQGEMEMAQFNKTLGRFELSDIPPAPLGEPQIEVTFQIDVDGILEVSARDLETGHENQINVKDSVGLGEEEIARLTEKQNATREEDHQMAELALARNEADLVIKDAERRLIDMDFLLDSERDLINERGFALKDAVKGDDPAEIRRRTQDLNQAFHEASRRIYQEQEARTGEHEIPPDVEHQPAEEAILLTDSDGE